jgi:hypothetical protein
MMKAYHVAFTQRVVVTLDESKFTWEWMEEFRKHFYQLEGISDHAQHLAQMFARGLINEFEKDPFVEGYGHLSEMGVKIEVVDSDTELEFVGAPE